MPRVKQAITPVYECDSRKLFPLDRFFGKRIKHSTTDHVKEIRLNFNTKTDRSSYTRCDITTRVVDSPSIMRLG